MISVIKNLSPLRIEVPEQYPIEYKSIYYDEIKGENNVVQGEREEWRTPRRCVKGNKVSNIDEDMRIKNYYEVLSDDYNSNEDVPGYDLEDS